MPGGGGGQVRRQEQHGVGDILRCGESAECGEVSGSLQRVVAPAAGGGGAGVDAVEQRLGRYRAGGDGVDADALSAPSAIAAERTTPSTACLLAA